MPHTAGKASYNPKLLDYIIMYSRSFTWLVSVLVHEVLMTIPSCLRIQSPHLLKRQPESPYKNSKSSHPHLTPLLSHNPISLSVLNVTISSLVLTTTSPVLTVLVAADGSSSLRQPSFQAPVVPVGSWVAGGRVNVRRSQDFASGRGVRLGDCVAVGDGVVTFGER